jgi:hypothetical protein
VDRQRHVEGRAEALKLVKKSGLSWVRTIPGAGSRERDDWTRRYSPTSTRREEFEDEKEL